MNVGALQKSVAVQTLSKHQAHHISCISALGRRLYVLSVHRLPCDLKTIAVQTESASRALLQATAKDCAALYPVRKGAGRAAYQRCLQRVEAILKCDFASDRSICSDQQDRNTCAVSVRWSCRGGTEGHNFMRESPPCCVVLRMELTTALRRRCQKKFGADVVTCDKRGPKSCIRGTKLKLVKKALRCRRKSLCPVICNSS